MRGKFQTYSKPYNYKLSFVSKVSDRSNSKSKRKVQIHNEHCFPRKAMFISIAWCFRIFALNRTIIYNTYYIYIYIIYNTCIYRVDTCCHIKKRFLSISQSWNHAHFICYIKHNICVKFQVEKSFGRYPKKSKLFLIMSVFIIYNVSKKNYKSISNSIRVILYLVI